MVFLVNGIKPQQNESSGNLNGETAWRKFGGSVGKWNRMYYGALRIITDKNYLFWSNSSIRLTFSNIICCCCINCARSALISLTSVCSPD
jgi:hypothetical protein